MRAYHLIRNLSRDFDICLFAVHEHTPATAWINALKPYCYRIETGVVPPSRSALSMLRYADIPFQVAYFYSDPVMKKLLHFVSDCKPDAVFCHLIRMAEYAKRLDIKPRLLDYMDTFSKGMERMAEKGSPFLKIPAAIEHKRLLKYEHDLFPLFDKHIIISGQDRDLIPHPQRNEIQVIPNGVDFNYFSPQHVEKKYDLLFNGHLSYPPNIASSIYCAKEIFPLIKKEIPGISLLLAGANPVEKIKKLQGNGITVKGWMDDIREAFSSSRIMLAPMLISIGLQNKILQAMAMKIPCIISPMANNALGAEHGKQLFVAENPEDYKKYVIQLLTDDRLYNEMTESAFNFVKENFSWEENTGKISSMIKSLLQ